MLKAPLSFLRTVVYEPSFDMIMYTAAFRIWSLVGAAEAVSGNEAATITNQYKFYYTTFKPLGQH